MVSCTLPVLWKNCKLKWSKHGKTKEELKMKYEFVDQHGVIHFAKSIQELQVKMQQAREN